MSIAKSDTSCQVLNTPSLDSGARQEVAVVKSPTIADDRLDGVKAIAGFVGEPPRRVNYLLEQGLLPAGKLGARWVGSKRRIAEHYTKLTAGA